MAIFLESVLQRSMSGVWKRGHGRDSKAPPDERGGNSSTYSKGATSRLHRRAGAAAGSLHPAGARTAASDPAAQAPLATTATAADRHSHRPPPTPVVQTFRERPESGGYHAAFINGGLEVETGSNRLPNPEPSAPL